MSQFFGFLTLEHNSLYHPHKALLRLTSRYDDDAFLELFKNTGSANDVGTSLTDYKTDGSLTRITLNDGVLRLVRRKADGSTTTTVIASI